MTVRAVIFDCDGVLVDSEPASAKAWKMTLAGYGYELSAVEFGGFVGTTDWDLAATFGDRLGVDPTAVLAAANDQLREVLAGGLRAFHDSIGLLTRLNGMPVAVASNSDRWRLEAVLAAAGLDGRFEVSVTADEVLRPKPAPDVYLRTAELLNLRPADCLVIEDSPTGVTAAVAAGMPVVAVDRGHFSAGQLEHGDRVLSSLDDLQSW